MSLYNNYNQLILGVKFYELTKLSDFHRIFLPFPEFPRVTLRCRNDFTANSQLKFL